MVEAHPFKYYLAKYFLLVVAVIQWAIGAAFFYFDEFTFVNFAVDALFIIAGVLLAVMFIKMSEKIKRVAIGKNKFVVLEGHYNVRFEWPEVKYIRIVPVLNLCRVKFRGKKGSVYFFSTRNLRDALEKLSAHLSERNKPGNMQSSSV